MPQAETEKDGSDHRFSLGLRWVSEHRAVDILAMFFPLPSYRGKKKWGRGWEFPRTGISDL